MDSLSWEEKYLRLRAEKDEIAKKSTEQDRAIRQMRTKFAKLESLFKQKQRAEGGSGPVDLGDGDGVVGGRRADKDNEQLVTDLYKRNAKLQRENKAYEEKNKSLTQTCQKLKRELQLARRRGGTRAASRHADTSGADDSLMSTAATSHAGTSNLSSAKLADLTEKLRHRLINAEKQLGKLREENSRLRAGGKTPIHDEMDSTMAAARSAKWTSSTAEGEEIIRLQRELRDTSAKLQLLQTRYDHMESKTKAQNELQHGSFEQLEEYNRRIRDLRMKLQEAQHDKEVADSRASRAEEYEEQVRELSEQNRYLEDQVTRLCEAPFLSTSGVKSAVTDFDRQERQHKAKIEKLQEVAQTHHAALTALQKEADLLKREKESLQRQLDRSSNSAKEADYAHQVSRDKGNLFGSMSDLADLGMEDVDMKELERALAIVRRKMDDPTDLDFLEKIDDEDLTTVPALKKRLQMVQVANLNITRELERAERMLKAQASINRDLHLEIEEAHKRSRSEKDSLQAKLEDFESLSLKRLQRIHSLEAQVRQHLYAVGNGGGGKFRKTPAALDDVVGILDEEDNLLQEISNGDFGPDENLIEVYIIDSEISENVISSESSTFVLVDFFDYESQATPLVTGLYPRYDFATTYKVTVDDFFLRFLATDSLSIELNKAHNADYQLLARASVTLSALLESSPRILLSRLPLVSTKDGSIAGYVHLEVRMALPVTELYRLFLDRHPEERSRIEEVARKNLKSEIVLQQDGTTTTVQAAPTSSSLGPREEARLSNELSVTVKSASGLVKKGKTSPSTYVHYQLLGFQDTFTSVIDYTSEPNYNHKFSFPIITDPKLLRFLRKYKLVFTVFEDASEGDDDAQNILFGEAKVSLGALSNGEDLIETLTLYNSHKHEVGTISVEVRWNSPLKRPADAGPNALTSPEVEEIMSRFGPDKDGQVNYLDFVRFADPPPAVMAALESFSSFLTMARKEQGISTSEFFEALCEGKSNKDGPYVDSETFVSNLIKMQVGIPPDEIAAVFTHIDASGANVVTLKDFLKFAEPPSSSATSIITEKLRLRSQHLHRLGQPIMVPFQRADPSGSAKLTRLQFKECLREIGFKLVDDDFVEARAVKSSIKPPMKAFGDDVEEDDEEVIGGGYAGRDVKEAINERFDESRNRASATNANVAENEKRRLEFDRRVKELTQQSNAAAASIDFNQMIGDDDEEENALNSSNMGKTAPVSKPPTGKAKQPEPYQTPLRPDMAATHSGIVHATPVVGDQIDSSAAGARGSDVVSSALTDADSMNIVDVESLLTDSCKVFKGAKVLPEGLKKSLQTADDSSEGYLSKRKFASTLASNESMGNISSEALKSIMDYFQKSNSGSQIDYRAFLAFMEWKKPANGNGVKLMAKMLLHSETAMDEFGKFDREGSGNIKRADFYEGLRELGFSQMSSSDMDDIASLFEFGVRKGEVYYSAFVEYVTQQESILELKDVESRLRNSIRNQYSDSSVAPADALRAAFAKFDPDGKGVIDANDFSKGLDSLGFKLTRSDMDALYTRADPRGEGVTYNDFSSFIVNDDDNSYNEPTKSLADFDLAILQLKSQNVVKEVKERMPNLESLSDPFKHYDWRRSGKLSLRPFAAAVRAAGFVLTRAEIVVLAQHFGQGKGGNVVVTYNDFLNWATPDANAPAPVIGGAVNLESLLANLRRLAARSENGSYTKWADVFESSDVDGSGMVDEEGCRVALRRLGVKINDAEARALSNEFGGGKKHAVRYRALLRLLFPGSSGNENAKGIAALRRLQASANRLDSDLNEITRAAREIFAELDMDGIGYVTKRSFKRGMVKLVSRVGLAAPSDNDLEELMERFDTAGDGSVGWKEFVSESFAGGSAGGGEELEAVSRFKSMVRKCIRKGVDYRAAFERLDEGFKGSLSLIDFKSALQELGSGLTEGETNALALKFRSPASARRGEEGDSARVVLYLELLHSLVPVREVEWDEPDGWRIEEKLRSMIKNRFEFWVPGKLKKAFKFFDRPTPRGRIGVDQLSDGLKRLKAFRLSASQEKKLFDIMDLSGEGRVTYSDFVTFVRDANYNDVCMKVITELGKATVRWSEVNKGLEKKDDNGSGVVSMKDFKDVMDKLGVTLSKADCLRLVLRFDEEEGQNVTISKFVDFVKNGGKRKNLDGDGVVDDEDDLTDDDSDDEDGDGKASKDKASKKQKVAKLMKKLKAKVQAAEDKGVSGKRSFKFFDKDGSGHIDEDEFRQGCKRLLKVNLTKGETAALMDKFKSKRVGKIKYAEFLDALGLGEEEGGEDDDKDLEEEEEEEEDEDEDYVVKKKAKKGSRKKDGDFAAMVRKEINRMARSGKGKPKLKSVFNTFDRNGNGKLSEREFKRALSKMGFEFSSSEMARLLTRLDEDGDEQISWKEFERFARLATDGDGDDDDDDDDEDDDDMMTTEEMRTLIKKQLKKLSRAGDSPNVKRVFSRLDIDSSDYVSKREFKKACEDMGFEFSSSEIKSFLKKFDKKDNGKIYYAGFVKLAKGTNEDDGDESEDGEVDIDNLALMVRKELKRLTKSSRGPPKVRKVFEDLDRNGNGKISKREFKNGLRDMGFKFKTTEIDDLMDYLDTDDDGQIDFEEYEKLLGIEKDEDGGDSDDGSDETDSPYSMLMEKVVSALERGRDVLEAFEFFDSRNAGEISKDDFKEGLAKLKIKANGKAIGQAFSKFKGRRAGKIMYKDFVRAVEKKTKGGKKKKKRKTTGRRKTINDDGESDYITRKLKKELARITKSSSGPPRFRAIFEEIDDNGNGTIELREFTRGLETMGFDLSKRETKAVFAKFDEDDNGTIDFEEFAYFMTGEDEDEDASDDGDDSEQDSDDELDELVQTVRKEFKRITKSSRGPPRVRQVFEEIDTNGDGQLSKREFRDALDELGFRFSERQVKDLMFKVDSDGNGKCDYEEFENICISSRAGRSSSKSARKKKGGRGFDIDSDILRKIRKARVVRKGNLLSELENADEDANRRSKEYLKTGDFKNFIKESLDDVRLSRGDLNELVESCDPDATGKVKYEKFVAAVDK